MGERAWLAGWAKRGIRTWGGGLAVLETGRRSLMLLPAQLLAGLALREGREQHQRTSSSLEGCEHSSLPSHPFRRAHSAC